MSAPPGARLAPALEGLDAPCRRELLALVDRLLLVVPPTGTGTPAERALAPLLAVGEGWLGEELARSPLAVLPGARRELLAVLSRRLGRVALQVLALEHRALEAAGGVSGARPELDSRPAAWVERFEQYPVLAGVVTRVFTGWRTHVGELLGHLSRDRAWLAGALFGGQELPALAGVDGEAGDVHAGGRAVAVLRFEDGRQLVYKPRDLRATRRVLDLLDWLNAAGLTPPLAVRGVLTRGSHGWEEHVAVAACVTHAQVERFFVRVGMLLRLMQLLEAGDLTRDNVLAHGEHPVLLDLEVVLQPRPAPTSGDAAEALLRESVARLGLLSSPFPVAPGVRARNVGALAPPGDLVSVVPYLPAHTAVEGTARPSRDGRPIVRGGQALLLLGSEPVEPAAHMERVLEGYRRMHAFLLAHRDGLLAPGGPLAALSGLPVRYLHRYTARYLRSLWAGLAPASMLSPSRWRSAVEASLAASGAADAPALREAEVAALAAAEVPMFLCHTDGDSLLGPDGRTVREGFFAGSALERVRQRLRELEDFPFQRHEELLLSTFATCRPAPPPSCVPRPPVAAREEDWLVHAVKLGDLLVESALPADGGVSWVGLSYEPFHDCEWMDRLEPELLSGSAGIAVVLADLYAASGREPFRRTALLALEEARRRLARAPRELERALEERPWVSTGGFLGVGAGLYALARCALPLRVPELAREAAAYAGALPVERLCAKTGLELASGATGLLLALHRAGAAAAARAGLDVLQARLAGDSPRPAAYPPGARIHDALPDVESARALCLLRLTGEAPLPPAGATGSGSLLARLELGSRAREPLRFEVARQLAVSPASGPARLERLDVALEATAVLGDEGLREAAVRLALEFLHAWRGSGRWFPDSWAADRHQLSALWGLPALAHAFLRLGAPGRFTSLRLLR